MDPLVEAKKILLNAQGINTNPWYGEQFQNGLDEIPVVAEETKKDPLHMRYIPKIILALSEVSIMMNGQNNEKILDLQEKLWKLHGVPDSSLV